MVHIKFAYKCKICGDIVYRNTTRSCNNYCRHCGKNSLERSKSNDGVW